MTARRLHVFHPRPEALVAAVAEAAPDAEVVSLRTEEELLGCFGEVENLLAMRPPRRHWGKARRLRLLQMVGVGVDSVLPARDLHERVRIANASGIAATALAEFALSLILALEKQLPRAVRQQDAKRWRPWVPRRLEGQTVAILGLGAIGRALAERLVPLGVRVVGTRRSARGGPEGVVAQVLPPVSTAEALRQATIAVVLLPKTAQTQNLLDGAMLDQMPEGARLVHLARGGIVDEEAVLERLESGRIGGAAFDVFVEEPLPDASPFWAQDRLLVTPHTSGFFAEYAQDLARLFVDNVERMERGEEPRNVVDRERGY